MRNQLKFVAGLLLVTTAFRLIFWLVGFQVPQWLAWLAFVIWVPIIVWFLIKLPGWRRDNREQQARLVALELATKDVRVSATASSNDKGAK